MAKVDFDWLDTSCLDWTPESFRDVLLKLNLLDDDGVEDSKGLGCNIRTYKLHNYDTDEEESIKLWIVWSLAKYGLEGPSEADVRREWDAFVKEIASDIF